jgi:hypothetical protein
LDDATAGAPRQGERRGRKSEESADSQAIVHK